MNVVREWWEVFDYYTLGNLICHSILIVNLQAQGLASSFQRDQLYRYIIGMNNIIMTETVFLKASLLSYRSVQCIKQNWTNFIQQFTLIGMARYSSPKHHFLGETLLLCTVSTKH